MRRQKQSRLKSRTQIGYQREAGLVVAEVHRVLREAARPGVSLLELDRLAYEATVAAGAKPNFLHYQGFPATVCMSVNDVIVHGIPDERVLAEGDLVSFDCGAYVERDGKQWHADAAFTHRVGPIGKRLVQLDEITENAMWAGVAAVASAKRIGDIGAAIEDYVDEAGAGLDWTPGLIEGYTGHGIGNRLHEEPTVYNYRVRGRTEQVEPGLVICIEPMVVAGTIETKVASDHWAVLTRDGAPAAHWEHTVAVLDEGIAVLTAADGGVAGLAPFGVTPVVL
ncbi:type I methionyl aminopeptidase [Actinomyces sp. F1_1611]